MTVGQVIGRMKSGGERCELADAPGRRGAAPPAQAAPEPVAEPQQGEEVLPTASASPRSPRRVAAAEGIDLSSVQGSGPGGRILKADVLGRQRQARAARRAARRRTPR